MFLAGLCFALVCFGSVWGGNLCAYALGISLLFCVVQFSLFLQDSVTPGDEETTPEEPWVVETTFVVGGGVVTPSAWTSRLRFGR